MEARPHCIHFIGIGGVGMSGIARIAADFGYEVSGSDAKASYYTDQLADAHVTVHIGHDARNVPEGCDTVVVSTAIPESNPELAYARAHGIRVWKRAQMLAELGRGRKTIAAAGTHGKTTTSSMLVTAFAALGADPTFVVGGILNAYDANAAPGKGPYYIVEADESDKSFLYLSPYVTLVTNVEADHLDHYPGGIDEIRATFERFMGSVPSDGVCVVCAEDPHLPEMGARTGRRCVTYGFVPEADVHVEGFRAHGIGCTFDVVFPDGVRQQVTLPKNPGRHNALNAAGVLSVVWALGADVARAAAGLSGYAGVRRRFDVRGEADGVTVVDDYAHHPTEIAATIDAAKALDFDRVCVLFQPHRYSRTASLTEAFSHAFDKADALCVMDVYAAGGDPIEGVSGKLVADAVSARGQVDAVSYEPDFDRAVEAACAMVRPGDLLITMGAGDVTKLAPRIVERLAARAQGAAHPGTAEE